MRFSFDSKPTPKYVQPDAQLLDLMMDKKI